ncbi:MAG TPA: thermonuclease family protein [Pirellulales bacterium]|nr:thermonuclease family protein [Pirellulales bacterium]
MRQQPQPDDSACCRGEPLAGRRPCSEAAGRSAPRRACREGRRRPRWRHPHPLGRSTRVQGKAGRHRRARTGAALRPQGETGVVRFGFRRGHPRRDGGARPLRPHRTLGTVWLDGESVNRRLVADGWAWHYIRYSDAKELADAEGEARDGKRGLWADDNAIAPWEWRKNHRKKGSMRRNPTARAKEPSPTVSGAR